MLLIRLLLHLVLALSKFLVDKSDNQTNYEIKSHLLPNHPSGERFLGMFGVEKDPVVLQRPAGVWVSLRLRLLLPGMRPAPGRIDVGRGRMQLRLLRRRRFPQRLRGGLR